MPKQPAFPGLRDAMKKKQTRRELFLVDMEAVVPWGRLLVLIELHYHKVGPKSRRPPMSLETMLRVYFLQNLYALSDPLAEETLYDSEAMRRFAGVIPPFLTGCVRRIYAAIFSFWAGVMPPIPMFGRSLL